MRETINLVSGSSVELKLRKRGENYYFDYGSTGNSSIPDDSSAEPNPAIGTPTTVIPNIQYTSEVVGSDILVRIDMTGIQNPETLEWLHLFGTKHPDQNIWISVDGIPKGFTIYNNADGDGEMGIMTDIVFVVDNSGSMSEEAEAVARDILSWSQLLTSSGLNVRFACVGYSVSGTINGGIDFTDANGLSSYLNRSTGTSRTMGFSGGNSSVLSSAASAYRVSDECGAMAILRGIRSVKDYEYEMQLADVNRQLSGIETLVLFADPQLSVVSSSIVRELAHFGKDIKPFLPEGLCYKNKK